jgi:hypothetical protein
LFLSTKFDVAKIILIKMIINLNNKNIFFSIFNINLKWCHCPFQLHYPQKLILPHWLLVLCLPHPCIYYLIRDQLSQTGYIKRQHPFRNFVNRKQICKCIGGKFSLDIKQLNCSPVNNIIVYRWTILQMLLTWETTGA